MAKCWQLVNLGRTYEGTCLFFINMEISEKLENIFYYSWCFFVYCHWIAAAAAKSLQSCPTLCDPTDGSPPGSPVPGILQARILGWVAISFSNAWKWEVKVKLLSHVRFLATPWTAAYQASPSVGFSRQEYWSGLPLPSPCHWIRRLFIHTTFKNYLSAILSTVQ